MSLIKNLIKESEVKPNTNKKSKSKGLENDSDDEKKIRPVIKSALDLQRLKLEKLMKNPDKPVIIPEHRKDKDFMQSVPTFVRNVMGSSAGAGSGEFHVYRHLRRKEYARQKMIQSKSHQEQLDDDYQQKLEDNRQMAEDKTAKKRAKRLKKKQRAKKPKIQKSTEEDNSYENSDDNTSDDEQHSKIQEICNENHSIDKDGSHESKDVQEQIPDAKNDTENDKIQEISALNDDKNDNENDTENDDKQSNDNQSIDKLLDESHESKNVQEQIPDVTDLK